MSRRAVACVNIQSGNDSQSLGKSHPLQPINVLVYFMTAVSVLGDHLFIYRCVSISGGLLFYNLVGNDLPLTSSSHKQRFDGIIID